MHTYIFTLSISLYIHLDEFTSSLTINNANVTLEPYFIGFHTHISSIVKTLKSQDGKRPTEQFYKEIPLSHRRNVLMSTAGGACLYRNAEKSDFEFWKQGGGGIPNPDSIHVLAVNLARSYLLDSYAQNSLLDHLQTSRREKILQFLNRFSSLESLSQKLECDEAFLSHGSLVPGLSFVWTNRCDYGVTNMFVLGMPISISNRYVTPSIREALNRLGSDCSLAPNSVCIKSRGVDKDTPLRWLHDSTKDFEFSISNQSVAIGDNPNGNDRALTSLFDEYNLSFVNCFLDKGPPGNILLTANFKIS